MWRAVCLDLMDTLVVDPYREAIAAGAGAPLADVADDLDPDAWPDFELGRIDEATFAQRFFRADSGRRLDIGALNAVRRAGYALIPGMAALLDDLGGHVARHLATNYPVWVDEAVAATGLDARVEGVHASYEMGSRKPDPAFFTTLADRVDAPPERCVFVDDRPINCAAAADAGYTAVVFTTAAALSDELRSLGVLDPPGGT